MFFAFFGWGVNLVLRFIMPKNKEFISFVQTKVAQNPDWRMSQPGYLPSALPKEYALDRTEIQCLLERPEGFRTPDPLAPALVGRAALEKAYDRGESMCASALQQDRWEMPPMRAACQSLMEAVGAEAVFAAVHITPPGSWGSGQHADTGWTLVGQLAGEKTWHLEPPTAETLDDLLHPKRDDYHRGAHTAEPYVTAHPGDVVLIPSGWRHAAISSEGSVHVSYGGSYPGMELGSIYRQE